MEKRSITPGAQNASSGGAGNERIHGSDRAVGGNVGLGMGGSSMTDITLCANSSCTKRGSCLRYTAKASDYQSMAVFEQKDGECSHYIYEPGTLDEEPAQVDW